VFSSKQPLKTNFQHRYRTLPSDHHHLHRVEQGKDIFLETLNVIIFQDKIKKAKKLHRVYSARELY
jgi:hypothetical protein